MSFSSADILLTLVELSGTTSELFDSLSLPTYSFENLSTLLFLLSPSFCL